MPYKDPEKKKATEKAYRERNREHIAKTEKAYRERNREHIAATDRIWREGNRERRAATNKAWCERNRERKAETDRAWCERNPERRVAISKAYRERNPERVAASQKAYRERNPETKAENGRIYRCRKRNATIRLTANEKQKMISLERTRQELQKETGREHHIDHIIPIVHGGIHHPINLRILDGRENLSKHDKLLPEAIALAPEHFRLYSERISPERAWEFVRQLAEGLGLGEDDLDALVTGKPLKSKNVS